MDSVLADVFVDIVRMDDALDLPLPSYMTEGAAGMDLYANVFDSVDLPPQIAVAVRCGIRIALPMGYEAQVRPRSGLALKHSVTMANAPGTIDWDYRGEIIVPMINLGDNIYTIHRGDRIAQMVIGPVTHATLVLVNELSDTERGHGGFGHTGLN